MRRMASLCLALLALSGVLAIYAESLPKGWEVWPWEFGATAEIRMDEEIKYQGASSLAIENPTGILAVVLPSVDLIQGQSYVFKAWLRTDLQPDQEAHLAVALYDAGGNYLSELKSEGLTGKTDWKQVKIEVQAANAAKVAVFCRVWGGGSGTAWFDELTMEEVKPFRRVQLPCGGFEPDDFAVPAQPLRIQPDIIGYRFYVWTELLKTPEADWYNVDRARIELWSAFGAGPSVWLQMNGMDSTTNFYNQRTLALNYGIRTFEVRDRFNYKNATLDWTFGRLWLDYSPYILTLTDDERGRYVIRHGVSLSNIPFANGTLACFVFPDGQNFAWGGRHRLTLGPATMNTTLFYLQRKFALVEQDFAYALSYKLPKGNFVLDLAQQKQQTGREAQTLLLTYESGSAPVSYKLSYFNFSPDFDPPYRDKMPQYSTETRSLTRWNVVDRYRGKKGAGLTLNLKEDTFGATGELETWQETSGRKYRFFGSVTSKVLDYTASASFLQKGHEQVNQYGTRQYFQDYFRFATGLRKTYALPLPVVCGFNYELEKYQGETNIVHEMYGEYTIEKSYFQGLKLKVGWEDNSRLPKPRAYFEAKWTLPNRVNLLFRHYTAELSNPSPYYDTVRERYMDYDNQLYLTFSASFSR